MFSWILAFIYNHTAIRSCHARRAVYMVPQRHCETRPKVSPYRWWGASMMVYVPAWRTCRGRSVRGEVVSDRSVNHFVFDPRISRALSRSLARHLHDFTPRRRRFVALPSHVSRVSLIGVAGAWDPRPYTTSFNCPAGRPVRQIARLS